MLSRSNKPLLVLSLVLAAWAPSAYALDLTLCPKALVPNADQTQNELTHGNLRSILVTSAQRGNAQGISPAEQGRIVDQTASNLIEMSLAQKPGRRPVGRDAIAPVMQPAAELAVRHAEETAYFAGATAGQPLAKTPAFKDCDSKAFTQEEWVNFIGTFTAGVQAGIPAYRAGNLALAEQNFLTAASRTLAQRRADNWLELNREAKLDAVRRASAAVKAVAQECRYFNPKIASRNIDFGKLAF